MSIESLGKLSSVSETSALIAADLTATKYQPAPVSVAPLDTFHVLQPANTLKDNAAASAFDGPLGFVSYEPLNQGQDPATVDWTIATRLPGDTPVTKISIDGKGANPIALFDGPYSQPLSAQITGAGIADLVVLLQAFWTNDLQSPKLHDTIERVIRDVCAKARPGDDLIGNICTAVAFVMWGAGYPPEAISSVRNSLQAALAKNFPGDEQTALAKMGQYFHNHDATELLGGSDQTNTDDLLKMIEKQLRGGH